MRGIEVSTEELRLLTAEKDVETAARNLERALVDIFPVGSEQRYRRARDVVACTVRDHRAEQVEVYCVESHRYTWIDYRQLVR